MGETSDEFQKQVMENRDRRYEGQIKDQQREELYVDMLLQSRNTVERHANLVWQKLEIKVKHDECAKEEAQRWVDLNSIIEAYTKALRGF